MKLITAPEPIEENQNFSVFLAGSIESDIAERWQDKVIKELEDCNLTFLNPRRGSWDASWKQEITNPMFREQVDWELDALECADMIIVYFDIHTKSPISLLELGLFARSKKIVVCCPYGFWRKGNVDIVCHRYGIQQVDDLEELINEVKNKIK